MTASAAVVAFLVVALVSALLACSARTAERLLWGTALCSAGLGAAVQISGGGYYGLMLLAVFLVTDLAVYLYLRTQYLLPSRPPKRPQADRAFRVFFLWLAGCAGFGAAFFLFRGEGFPRFESPVSVGIAHLHERVWSDGWLLVQLPVVALIGLVIGGFFLVRREP
jgi:hypothetical protein